MAKAINDKNCKLYQSAYCDMLNMPSCDACVAKDGNAEQIMEDLDALISLLPEEGVSSLFLSDECLLCKGEHKHPRECYALLDMAHPKPQRTRANALFTKAKAKTGSFAPLQIACCNACKRRWRLLHYIPMMIPLLVGIIALFLLAVPAISDALLGLGFMWPFAVFLLAVVLGLVVGWVVESFMKKAMATKMLLHPLELPLLQKMRERGWFALHAKRLDPTLTFSKERLQYGVCTEELKQQVETKNI